MDPHLTQFLAAERVREWRQRAAHAELVRQARRNRPRPARRLPFGGWSRSGGWLPSGGGRARRRASPVPAARPMPVPREIAERRAELAGDRRPADVR
jgi:hypothetical protein